MVSDHVADAKTDKAGHPASLSWSLAAFRPVPSARDIADGKALAARPNGTGAPWVFAGSHLDARRTGGRIDAALTARVALFKALVELEWAPRAMVRNRVSKLDFDFYKYCAWKHMRARFLIRDPRWPEGLRAV